MDQFIILSLVISSLAFGIFLFLKPMDMFEIQRRFYAAINWKIEPISVRKEIHNTKLMGIFLILVVIGVCIYFVLRNKGG